MFIAFNFHGIILEDIIFSSGLKKKILGAVAQNGQLLLTATLLWDLVLPLWPGSTVSIHVLIINGDLTAECFRPIKLIELNLFCHSHTKKQWLNKNTTAISWTHCVILAYHYIRFLITKAFHLFLLCLLSWTMEIGIHFARTILKFTAKTYAPNITSVFCCVGFCIRPRVNYGRSLA